jgi:hypothetical protein
MGTRMKKEKRNNFTVPFFQILCSLPKLLGTAAPPQLLPKLSFPIPPYSACLLLSEIPEKYLFDIFLED